MILNHSQGPGTVSRALWLLLRIGPIWLSNFEKHGARSSITDWNSLELVQTRSNSFKLVQNLASTMHNILDQIKKIRQVAKKIHPLFLNATKSESFNQKRGA